jgi:hypothetical protein
MLQRAPQETKKMVNFAENGTVLAHLCPSCPRKPSAFNKNASNAKFCCFKRTVTKWTTSARTSRTQTSRKQTTTTTSKSVTTDPTVWHVPGISQSQLDAAVETMDGIVSNAKAIAPAPIPVGNSVSLTFQLTLDVGLVALSVDNFTARQDFLGGHVWDLVKNGVLSPMGAVVGFKMASVSISAGLAKVVLKLTPNVGNSLDQAMITIGSTNLSFQYDVQFLAYSSKIKRITGRQAFLSSQMVYVNGEWVMIKG